MILWRQSSVPGGLVDVTRKARKLSRPDLAKQLDLAEGVIGTFEAGGSIRLLNLLAVVKALQTSMGALFPAAPDTPCARMLTDPTFVRLVQRLATWTPDMLADLEAFPRGLDAYPSRGGLTDCSLIGFPYSQNRFLHF